MTTRAAGDAIPPACAVIEVQVAELRQLFNSIDPSPFQERDLDPRAEEFIVGTSRDLPADAPLALLVHLGRPAGRSDEAALLRESIHFFFAAQADSARRRLRKLFRDGRVSLAIGLVVLAGTIALAEIVTGPGGGVGEILHESLLIGGWVAMWRPLEVSSTSGGPSGRTPSCSTGWPQCRCGSATRPLSRRGLTPNVGGVTGRQPPVSREGPAPSWPRPPAPVPGARCPSSRCRG